MRVVTKESPCYTVVSSLLIIQITSHVTSNEFSRSNLTAITHTTIEAFPTVLIEQECRFRNWFSWFSKRERRDLARSPRRNRVVRAIACRFTSISNFVLCDLCRAKDFGPLQRVTKFSRWGHSPRTSAFCLSTMYKRDLVLFHPSSHVLLQLDLLEVSRKGWNDTSTS